MQEGPKTSPHNRLMLILSGCGSHVFIEVVKATRATRLNMLNLPSHTSQALQRLDVANSSYLKLHITSIEMFGPWKIKDGMQTKDPHLVDVHGHEESMHTKEHLKGIFNRMGFGLSMTIRWTTKWDLQINLWRHLWSLATVVKREISTKSKSKRFYETS